MIKIHKNVQFYLLIELLFSVVNQKKMLNHCTFIYFHQLLLLYL